MIVRRLLCAVLMQVVFLQGAFAAPAAPAAPSSVFSSDLNAFLDGLADGQMQALGTPGIALAIVPRQGPPLVRAWGVGSGPDGRAVPIDPQSSVLPIASISKTFIAVALMRAIEQGRLRLDDPANKYLDFKLPRFPRARDITLRDLARHEAGFEERWLATGSGGEKPDSRPWGRILAETAPKLIAPPGAYASYSNYGAVLLAYIVQRATGIPYAQYLHQQVFLPLGMTSTILADPLPQPFASRALEGWAISGGVMRPAQHSFNVRSRAAGGIRTTLPDMARYIQMLLSRGTGPDGAQFLSPESVRTLLVPQRRLNPAMATIGTIFSEKDVDGIRFVGHGGDGDTHHTDMLLQPERGLGIFVVFLANPGAHTRDYFTRSLVKRLVPGSGPKLLPLPQGAAATRDLGSYAGAYRHYRWTQTSIERVLQLSSEFAVRDSGKGTLIMTGRLGPGEYVPVGKGLFQQRVTGEYLFFHPDQSGRMLLNQGTYPFVTAYRLDEIDTQAFNVIAYWCFVIGLTLLGLAALGWAVAFLRRRLTRAAIGYAVLGSALTASGIGLYFFFTTAAGMSEDALQFAVPSIAYWLLAIPPVATLFIAVFAAGWVRGDFRAREIWATLLAGLGVVLFALFVVYLVHWHGYGWQLPESAVQS